MNKIKRDTIFGIMYTMLLILLYAFGNYGVSILMIVVTVLIGIVGYYLNCRSERMKKTKMNN